jgi:hypothetical protein
MGDSEALKVIKQIDPLLERRSGDDRRKVQDLEFFERGGIERRSEIEARQNGESRVQAVNLCTGWKSRTR